MADLKPTSPMDIVLISVARRLSFFFFNDTATTEINTLSLHDALPILAEMWPNLPPIDDIWPNDILFVDRSEEHTSELQSPYDLVCRLLLEKKKTLHSILIYSIRIARMPSLFFYIITISCCITSFASYF